MTDTDTETVTVSVTNTERKQIVELLTDVIELYEEQQLPERVSLFAELQELFSNEIEDGFRTEYTRDESDWSDLVLGLEELDETRADWLKSKLARRARLPLPRMGFKRVPFMPRYIGNDPTPS